MENALTSRDKGMGDRLISVINRDISSAPSAFDATQALTAAQRAAAAPLYEKANAAAPLYSDRLEQFTKEPIVQKGLAEAMDIQRLEALARGDTFDPHSYSVTLDDLGTPTFSTAGPAKEPWRPPDIVEFLTRAGGIKDQGGELRAMDLNRVNQGTFGRLAHANGMPLDTARETAEEARYLPSGSDINDLLGAIDTSYRGKPVYSANDEGPAQLWQQWRSQELKAPQGPSDFAPGQAFDPNEMFQGLKNGWDMRTLDAAKRGLDNMLEQYRDSTTGRLALDQRGRAIDQVRRAYVSELDKLNPDYAAARSAFAGPADVKDAIALGRSFTTKEPEQIQALVGNFSPSQREGYLLGAAQTLRNQVSRTSDGGNEALRVGYSDFARRQLRPLFDSDAGFAAFMKPIDEERLGARTLALVPARPAGETTGGPTGVGPAVIGAVAGGNPAAGFGIAAARGLADLLSSHLAGQTPQAQTAAAHMLRRQTLPIGKWRSTRLQGNSGRRAAM